jgi:hypothetical protein
MNATNATNATVVATDDVYPLGDTLLVVGLFSLGLLAFCVYLKWFVTPRKDYQTYDTGTL